MQRLTPYLCLLSLLLFACEDVIDVEVPEEPPRLVVEGLLRVDVDETYIPVEIKLTQTASFFDTVEPVTDVDEIVIIYQELLDGAPSGNTGQSSLTQLEPGSGKYVPDPSFDSDQRIPTSILENDYLFVLVIEWRGRRYAAQTKFSLSAPIDRIEQGSQVLLEEEETEVKIFFTDDPLQRNFYVIDFDFGNFLPTEDSFYNGEQFSFSYFYDEQFDAGTELEISILGADLEFFNYMSLLVIQSDNQGPFQPPVATVRGNVFDVTGIDNLEEFDNVGQPEVFPLGYFAVVQEYSANLTIE